MLFMSQDHRWDKPYDPVVVAAIGVGSDIDGKKKNTLDFFEKVSQS
jgi:hypothetical protein